MLIHAQAAKLCSSVSPANTSSVWERGKGVCLPSVALKFVASDKLPPDGGVYLYKETFTGSEK